MSTELAAPITNRSESLKDLSCEKNRTIDPSTSMDSAPTKQEARLPPIYLYDVNNYKAMVDDLSKVVEEETYHSKDLPNNTIKVIPHIPDTYRKIIHHIREARIVHHIPNKAEPSLQNSHSWPPSLYTDLWYIRRNILRRSLQGTNKKGHKETLQMLQATRNDQQMEQNEATLTTPKEEAPKTSLLTAFVQHGVLTNGQL